MNIVLTFTPDELEALLVALTAASNRFTERSQTANPSMKLAYQAMATETNALWSKVYHATLRVEFAA